MSHRLLGGVIGSRSGKLSFIEERVKKWSKQVETLSQIAESQPQAAFAAFTKSLQFQWNFVQRVTPGCESLYGDLEDVILNKFLPVIMMGEVSHMERLLLSLPARWGGLGVPLPTEMSELSFSTSRKATGTIVDCIKGGSDFECESHVETLRQVKYDANRRREEIHKERFDSVIDEFSVKQQRAIRRIKDGKVSGWLTVLPLVKYQFDLSAQEFWDGMALRYKRPMINTPELCDGCGADFTLAHALSCRKGGLVIMRHNEVRDAIGDLASLVWNKVRREPIIRDADYQSNRTALVADIGIRGVWSPQVEALIDFRVIDTDAQSYSGHIPREVIAMAEREKKRKYGDACEERHSMFSPFCCSVDGMLGGEAEVFVKLIGENLSLKWDRNYSEIMGWIRSRLSFAILRSTILCLRNSRTKWRSLGV